MKAKEILDRFFDARMQRAFAHAAIRVEHCVQYEIPEHERDELRRGLSVARAADAARLQVFSKQPLAAFHALPPKLPREVGKIVGFGNNNAIKREKLRSAEHLHHHVADLGERLPRNLPRLDVIRMLCKQLLSMCADHADKKIGLGGKKRIECLLLSSRAARNFTGAGATESILQKYFCRRVQNTFALGVIQRGPAARLRRPPGCRTMPGPDSHAFVYHPVQLF